MDPLRISLLLIGAIIIGAIYLWDRWRRSQAKRDDLFDEALPSDYTGADDIDEWDIIPLPRQAERGVPMDEAQLKELAGFNGRNEKGGMWLDEETAAYAAFRASDDIDKIPVLTSTVQSTPSETLMVVSIIAQEGASFSGPTLSDLFEDLDLRYGDMQIFHRIDDLSGESVFSVVNIIEPGYFELETLPELLTPGLALFMRLPGPCSGSVAFEDFLGTARSISAALEGRLGDQHRRVLTEEGIAQMRARARLYKPAH